MTHAILHRDITGAVALPIPTAMPLPGAMPLPRARTPISIRLATLEDIPFIDALQKQHSKMVGFFPRQWFESNIASGNVLVAEELGHGPWAVGTGADNSGQGPSPKAQGPVQPVGYCVFKDKYLKREELGIIYQLNVLPTKQRGLIGASLVKAAFERCPYGVKLFCCWCAQDLEANYFWESLGFVPLAFRTGSRVARLSEPGVKDPVRRTGVPDAVRRAGVPKQPRIHIFWQRRIRAEEQGVSGTGVSPVQSARTGETPVPLGTAPLGTVPLTPYWFPSETSGGAVRENRLVLPIPPGTHWSDAKPAVLPGFDAKLLECANALPCHSRESGNPGNETGSPHARGRRKKKEAPLPGASKPRHGLWFAPPPPTAEELKAAKEAEKKAKAEERKRQRGAKRKNDPKLVQAARELRDRYIEEINAGNLLPPSSCGKYDVSRQLQTAPAPTPGNDRPQRLLEAA